MSMLLYTNGYWWNREHTTIIDEDESRYIKRGQFLRDNFALIYIRQGRIWNVIFKKK